MRDKILNHFQGNYKAFYGRYLQSIKVIGGDECQTLCPFHDDHKPSFTFNNQTGRYFCHGCKKKGDIFHFYGKTNGKGTKRGFGTILRGIANDFGIPWEEKKSKLVKAYDYKDADGNLISQTLRYEPKDFKQRRPNGKGEWIWKDVFKHIQPILYHLPEVLKAKEVIIVEGEKDVDNLIEMEFIATTCPMGAKKWRDEYNEPLRGKDIILIPDNDNEGREHMTQVAISLNGTAKNLKWIDLPNLPSKGDVSDWIAKFDDKEDAAERLAIMIENSDPYAPPKNSTLEEAF